MLLRIKKEIEGRLAPYLDRVDSRYGISNISPALFRRISDYLLRKCGRIRPLLLILCYEGYGLRADKNIYECALSMELLHSFVLIHDDIVDRSDTRRGGPAMHKMIGEETAIVAGDLLYSIALSTFVSAGIECRLKERALTLLLEAAVQTANGELLELTYRAKPYGEIGKKEIYRVYDLKTGHYSFRAPMALGSILAGAAESEIKKISRVALSLGRAFQIIDDMRDAYSEEGKITLPGWYERVSGSNAIRLAGKEAFRLLEEAKTKAAYLKMRPEYKRALTAYMEGLIGGVSRGQFSSL